MNNPSRKLRLLLCLFLVLQGVGVVAAGQVLSSANVPLTRVRLEHSLLTVAGAVIAAFGLIAYVLPAKIVLSFGMTTLIMIGTFIAGYRPAGPGQFSIRLGGNERPRSWQSETEWTEIHCQDHPVWVIGGIPEYVARQVHRDFTVTYRMDEDGWRRLPSPQGRRDGEVWFTGCSFTFGVGVEDDEVYPAVLAAQAWPTVKVRSYAIAGWGTTNCYLALEHHLAHRPAPRCVLYGWISHHRKRNYLRKSWFSQAGVARLPHFEVEGNQLQYLGMAPGVAADREDGPELDAAEMRLSVKLIREMQRLCRDRGVPFVLLILSEADDPVLAEIRRDPTIPILNVSGVSNHYHPNDGHPNAIWHRLVARAIAGDPLLARLTNLDVLHRTDAIQEPPRTWNLSVDNTDGGRAEMTQTQSAAAPVTVTVTVAKGKEWGVQLQNDGIAIRAGRRYTLQFKLRAGTPRRVEYAVSQANRPWDNLGLWGEVRPTADWQHVRREFVATRDEQRGRLVLAVGGSTGTVEVAEAQLLDDTGRDLLAAQP